MPTAGLTTGVTNSHVRIARAHTKQLPTPDPGYAGLEQSENGDEIHNAMSIINNVDTTQIFPTVQLRSGKTGQVAMQGDTGIVAWMRFILQRECVTMTLGEE
jgi:hypothetical protein